MPQETPIAGETLDILYRDEDVVVVNKPSGLLVHRSMIDRHETRFAVQILREQLGCYVYPAHRLDKPTSGALVFALNKAAARNLSEQFSGLSQRPVKKYLAVVRGYAPDDIDVDHPLREDLDKMTDRHAEQDKAPQDAKSRFACLNKIELAVEIEGHKTSRYSLIDCQPFTGRKHQLRRHCKHISHPIIGDAKHGRGRHNRYFKDELGYGRLLLHAYQLQFVHPSKLSLINCVAPLDQVFTGLLKQFDWQHSLPTALQEIHDHGLSGHTLQAPYEN